ncbi:hypothetical protein D1872_307190 [compost metagenome]
MRHIHLMLRYENCENVLNWSAVMSGPVNRFLQTNHHNGRLLNGCALGMRNGEMILQASGVDMLALPQILYHLLGVNG